MVLWVPHRLHIVHLFVVMGIFNLLLELELLKDLKVDKAGVKLFPALPLVLESKACTCDDLLQPKGNIDSGVLGSTNRSARLADCDHKLFDAFLVSCPNNLGHEGIITLLVLNGSDHVISQAQGKKHPGDRGPACLSKQGLVLAISGGTKVPCGYSPLACQTFHTMFI